MTTLIIESSEFSADRAVVEGDSHRHLFRARRLGPGDDLRVVDGRGRARWARVASVARYEATIDLGDAAPDHEPAGRLDLLVAALRPERASWLVEKTTEIGVRRIRFLASHRSPRTYGTGSLARLERVARSAVGQCGRSWVPEISFHREWSEVGDLLRGRDSWLLDPEADRGVFRPLDPEPAATLVVGPEGGFTDGELSELAELGCRSLSLGSRVLRVETAAVVGAAGLLLEPRGC